MGWTAILKGVEEETAAWRITLVYTDGISDLVRRYVVPYVDDATIKRLARNEVASLSRKESAKGLVKLQPGDVIDLSDPVAEPGIPPTAEEAAKEIFRVDYALLQAMQRGDAAGVLAADDKALNDLAAKCKAEFLPAYADAL